MLMALCRRCGSSYNVELEPPLVCHDGDDDWDVLHVDSDSVLDDLVDAWHDGAFDGKVELEDVIRASTGWSRHEYANWVRAGTPDDMAWPPDGLQPA